MADVIEVHFQHPCPHRFRCHRRFLLLLLALLLSQIQSASELALLTGCSRDPSHTRRAIGASIWLSSCSQRAQTHGPLHFS